VLEYLRERGRDRRLRGMESARMRESEMTRRIYKGGVDAVGVRGRPPVKCEDRLLECVKERGG